MSLDYSSHRRHLFGWIVLGIIAALVIGAILIPLLGYAFGFAPFTFYRPFFFFPFGVFFFILFLFFVVRFAFWGRWGGWGWRGRRGYYYADSKEILRQRYARGEISKEQFEQMMRDIDVTK